MKKILGFVMMLILMASNCFAQGPTTNASPVTVTVNLTTRYKNITFPFATRNLNIVNSDPNDAVFVDLKSDTNQTSISSCVLLAPGETIDLYDFITNGITIILDTIYIGGGNHVASPITVIASY